MNKYGKILIQGNLPNEWHEAYDWQKKLYKICLDLKRTPGIGYDSMKTDIYMNNNIPYECILNNGWGEIKLHNIKTDSLRRIIELPIHDGVKYIKN